MIKLVKLHWLIKLRDIAWFLIQYDTEFMIYYKIYFDKVEEIKFLIDKE